MGKYVNLRVIAKERNQPEYKWCNKCKTTKHKKEFYTNKTKSTGLNSNCKACDKKRYYEWTQNNPKKRNAKDKRAGKTKKKLEYNRHWLHTKLGQKPSRPCKFCEANHAQL